MKWGSNGKFKNGAGVQFLSFWACPLPYFWSVFSFFVLINPLLTWQKKKKMGLESEMWWEMVKLRSGVRLLHYLFTFYKWLAWYLGTQNIHVIKMVETKCSTSKRGLQEEEVKQWVLTTACLGQKQKEASGQVMKGKLLSVLVVRMGQDSKHHFCKWMGL